MGSGGGAGKQERALGSARLAPSGANAVSSTSSFKKPTPGKTVGVARGYLVPAIRSQPRVKIVPPQARVQRAHQAGPPLRVPLNSLPEGDGALQTTPGKTDTPPPSLTFDAIANLCGCYPPDTNGDVGGTQYMQWVNLHFAIYDKNTGAQLQAPRPGNQLFTGLPGVRNCEQRRSGHDLRPVRTSLRREPVRPDRSPSGNHQCVAVSTSDDATGTWCAYEFNVHNTKFNDYPKMGVWPTQHAYTMTANQFPPQGFGGVGVWALERDQMIANGCPAARMVYQDMNDIEPYLGTMIPADADGDTPPPTDAPAPLVSINQDGSGLPDDQIQIWNATVNWGARRRSPSHTTPTFRPRPSTKTSATSGPASAAWNERQAADAVRPHHVPRPVPQLRQLVDACHQPLGRRRQRSRRARWYHMEKQGSAAWGMRDQGTYAPADGLNRWMPSAAMDKSGNIAVGYSTSNGTAPNYPSIRYATRLATDPPGELGSEETIMVGTGSQTGTASRWGDYSSMSVDPDDDCTFYYTTEYIQTTGTTTWRTRVGKFTIPTCGPPPTPASAAAAATTSASSAAASAANG